MLRLLADENFNDSIVRGLLRRNPELDVVRVQEVGVSGADDRSMLAWAANEERILLTHDQIGDLLLHDTHDTDVRFAIKRQFLIRAKCDLLEHNQ